MTSRTSQSTLVAKRKTSRMTMTDPKPSDEEKPQRITFVKPEWGFEAWLAVGGALSGPEVATPADLLAAGFVPLSRIETEIAGYEKVIAQLDEWLISQADHYKQNPQVHRTHLDVATKLAHLLRG